MDDSTQRRGTLLTITAVLCVAVFAAFLLSAWSLYASHQQACESRNTAFDVLHDVLIIATTPTPGQKVTAEQQAQIARFRQQVFARIDAARCT